MMISSLPAAQPSSGTLEEGMTWQIELSPAVEAKAKGMPLERHGTESLSESALANPAEIVEAARPLSLPLLKGSVVGSLSRRDIYDDRG